MTFPVYGLGTNENATILLPFSAPEVVRRDVNV